MREIAVVIPSHNGSEELTALLPKLRSVLEELGEWELVVVDDGSAPADRERFRSLVAATPGVRLIQLPERTGQIYATLAGVSVAEGAIIVTMDDDGGHPPEAVAKMVELLRRERRIRLVYAAPIKSSSTEKVGRNRATTDGGGRPVMRRIGTHLNNALFHRFLGLPRKVPVTSFRAIRRDLLTRALARPVRYPYLSAMLLSFAPEVACVRYLPPPRNENGGTSRHNFFGLLSVWVALLLYWGPLEPVGRFLRRPRPPLRETVSLSGEKR